MDPIEYAPKSISMGSIFYYIYRKWTPIDNESRVHYLCGVHILYDPVHCSLITVHP